MANAVDHLERVGEVVQDLRDLGLEPILVGGMALVVLGSRRVTRDFDFVVASPRDRLADTLDCFYNRGLELVSRLSDAGDVRATIGNRKVASIRLRQDAPASAYFFNVKTGLRIDLLFDFPIPAAELAERATRITIRSHVFHIAARGWLVVERRLNKASRSVRTCSISPRRAICCDSNRLPRPHGRKWATSRTSPFSKRARDDGRGAAHDVPTPRTARGDRLTPCP